MKECTEYMIGKFLAYMEHDSARFLSKIADCPLDELYLITPEYLIPYLNFIKDNRRLSVRVLKIRRYSVLIKAMRGFFNML